MWRQALLSLCLSGCGYIGFGTQNVVLDDGGTDAVVVVDADASPPLCVARASADYCATIPNLPDAPVIDGVVDCGLTLQGYTPAGWYSDSAGTLPSNVISRYAAAWRANGLYVFIEVDDPNLYPATIADGLLYCGDGAEIYVDTDGTFGSTTYDSPGTRQFLGRAPMMGGATRSSIGEVFAQQLRVEGWRAAGFAVFVRPGGYALEAFITAADMGVGTWNLAAGNRVGLDLGVNVSTPDGSTTACNVRLGQFFLRDNPAGASPCFGRPYCDTTGFCRPTLATP